jgi:hypothetical protein
MKYIALFGLLGGGVVAVGQMSAAQWQQIGQAAIAIALRYGLIVLPWLLAALFAVLWWRSKQLVAIWREGYHDQSKYYAARLADQQAAAQRRKRAPR